MDLPGRGAFQIASFKDSALPFLLTVGSFRQVAMSDAFDLPVWPTLADNMECEGRIYLIGYIQDQEFYSAALGEMRQPVEDYSDSQIYGSDSFYAHSQYLIDSYVSSRVHRATH